MDPLLLNTFNQHTYTLWNADVPTPPDQNMYAPLTHLHVAPNFADRLLWHSYGSTHGVFLRNSNGMDIILNHDPNPYATMNIDGGVLDFFVFIGPDPQAAVAQYHQVIGTPHMPPYWALGWHQCKYGWPNLQTLKSTTHNRHCHGAASCPAHLRLSRVSTFVDRCGGQLLRRWHSAGHHVERHRSQYV